MKLFSYHYQMMVRFDAPVRKHAFLLRCVPAECACQQLAGCQELYVRPQTALHSGTDGWGNPVRYGAVAWLHDHFAVAAAGRVALERYALPDDGTAPLFRTPTPLTAPTDEMADLAAGAGGSDILETALELSERLHACMRYAPLTTGTATTAAEAFAQRAGVCQDYAHILSALCRTRGVAARYVAGMVEGTGATHAWVEVMDRGTWRGVDPTHNRLVEFGYIKLSHGRDAMDCPVNRGVFVGTAGQETEIRVIVEES